MYKRKHSDPRKYLAYRCHDVASQQLKRVKLMDTLSVLSCKDVVKQTKAHTFYRWHDVPEVWSNIERYLHARLLTCLTAETAQPAAVSPTFQDSG